MEQFARGAFSEVFDLGDGRILKAFVEDSPAEAQDSDRTLISQIAFLAERRFYESIQEHPTLATYVPAYYGVADPDEYLIQSARPLAPGFGLILEKIPGVPVKFSELLDEIERAASEVIERMKGVAALENPWDGSCFVPGTRQSFTLIDIATPTDRLSRRFLGR